MFFHVLTDTSPVP